MRLISHLALTVLGFGLIAPAAGSLSRQDPAQPPAAQADQSRHVLENGATILIHPVPGVGQVAVEAFYNVGLVHEPAGMPQAAHLLEHLVCNAATAGYEPGESMAWLNQSGLSNAETMPDWTHYDYMLPADQLERILEIEAERLGSLKIDEAIIRQEGPRAAQEVDFVENRPAAGMGKFAFCAIAQSWRHGRDVAHIRTGLDEFSPGAMAQFHRSTYRPQDLTLIIVGDFEPDRALALARKHIGGLPKSDAPPTPPIDWSKVPKHATVKWDSKVQAVCIAFPPPNDPLERAALSLWGMLLQQQLSADAEVAALADAVYTPNHMWPVGELPFFIYAAAKPGADLEKLEALLTDRIAKLVESGGGIQPAMLTMFIRQLSSSRQMLNEPAVRQAAKSVAGQTGRDEKQAMAMVLGQGAINWGAANRFLGEDPAALAAQLEALTPERASQIRRQNLGAERMIVTRLVSESQE